MSNKHHSGFNKSLFNINDYVQKLSIVESKDEVSNICSKIAQEFEVSFFSCGFNCSVNFHDASYLLLSNCDSSWLEEYSNLKYQIVDPRIRECAATRLPVLWNIDNGYLHNLPQESKKMMLNAYDHNIRSGVTIPFYFPLSISGIFSLGMNADLYMGKKSLKHLQAVTPYISYLGGYINKAILRIINLERNNQKGSLTRREKDCLCWLADGKTASETASNLFISESTVKFHCKNSMRKLGAKNTSQALAIAIIRGYIRPVMGNNWAN
jgi:DNA-binding CsgD family transcriptional regulator